MANKKPCECCENDMFITWDGRNGHQLAIEIYPDNHLMGITSFAKDENGETTEETITIDYEYCMFCGRKLI